jgi:hypothetical protein
MARGLPLVKEQDHQLVPQVYKHHHTVSRTRASRERMRTVNTHHSFRTGILVILLGVGFQLGCEQGGEIVGPGDDTNTASLQRASTPGMNKETNPAFHLRALLNGQSADNGQYDHGLLGSATKLVFPVLGGTLRLLHSTLVLLPGSLSNPVAVSWSIEYDEPTGLTEALPRTYRFSPEGLVFQIPAKAFISFEDAGLGKRNPYAYTFYYFNESTRTWEKQETQVNLLLHQYVVTMNHFSRYAFGR